VSIPNAKGGNVWNVPLTLEEQQVHVMLCESLKLVPQCQFDIEKWRFNIAGRWDTLMNMNDTNKEITIGIIGKYTENTDAYLSVIKGLQHACIQEGLCLHIKWIESSLLENNCDISPFETLNGILIPGGFGNRGVEGMIKACEYARNNKIPFLGICLGMQLAVIEFCRNVIGITNANSEEFSGDTNDTIVRMVEHNNGVFGGTMRLGLCGTTLNPFSIAYELYQQTVIYERHRHRYIVHPLLVTHLQHSGMVVSGKDEVTKSRVEIIELASSQHPFYVACQFHPEYKTRPLKPSPLFLGFVKASLQQK
jgi:CTP synthase